MMMTVVLLLPAGSFAGEAVGEPKTGNEQGFYHFQDLEPGDYCVMPNPKMICEGYQATKSITQKVRVEPGQDAEVEWFGLDHFIDIN
ncbi:MAG: hypothetical protein P8Y54_08380 [Xanthomonadales bacterium]